MDRTQPAARRSSGAALPGPGTTTRRTWLSLLAGCAGAVAAGCAASGPARRARPVEADALFQPQPAPEQPSYAFVQRSCPFYIRSAHDGSMIPYGRLRKGDQVMVRSRAPGGWADVQLLSGHLVSVLAEDVGTRPAPTAVAGRRRGRSGGSWRRDLPAGPEPELPAAPGPEGEEGPSSVLLPPG